MIRNPSQPKVTITQIYKNEESVAIEAIYKFPIHEAAAICGFEAEIDGNRTVRGIVKEAQQAAKEYDEAIQVCINMDNLEINWFTTT